MSVLVKDACGPRLRLVVRRPLGSVVGVAALGVLYFLSARLGLGMAFPAEQVSAVWPPTGVALAAIFLFGTRLWPGVTLGALAANLLANEPLLTACGIAIGNTLEVIAGSWLLGRAGFRASIERVRDVLALILLAAMGSTLVSASVGVGSLCASGIHPWSSFGFLWSVWWLGDAMGNLVVAPALMVWIASPPQRWSWSQALEAGALFGALILSTSVVFLREPLLGHSLAYIVFPFVIWAALRFGLRATTLVGLIASGIAIFGTVRGWGPYAGGTVGENLVALQIFQCAVNVTGLLLGAAVSDRASAEKERKELLERERAARLEAEDANRMKDEFLAVLSHELRTPLSAILGWASLLNSGKLQSEESKHAVEVIERNAKNQAQLVEELLDVSRIISGKLAFDIQEVELVPILESALQAVRLAAATKRIEIRRNFASGLNCIKCDPNRLRQIVWNLLSNAVKFTAEGGSVSILARRTGASVELRVTDTGQGIKPAFLPYLFERFRQADSSTTRQQSGLGLGLFIVRYLVEGHGGTVSAESAGEGQGATFVVKLPHMVPSGSSGLISPVPKQIDRCPNPLVQLNGIRVLIVDDEPDIVDVMKRILEARGAEVLAASSASEAIRILKQGKAQVLVTDIGMPVEDGYSLIRRVRDLSFGLPAIALTAYARPEDERRARAEGFQAHISKPIEGWELVNVINDLLNPAGGGGERQVSMPG